MYLPVLQQMKGSEVCAPVVSMCAGTPECVWGKQSHVHEAAEEEAESHPGAGKGKQELTGSVAAPAAGPGQGDSMLLVSPASHGCLDNEGAGCAPSSGWTYVISATTLGEQSHSCPSERANATHWNTV